MEGEKISACTYTLNNEELIEECLKSLQWADEIIVLDSGSTDKTLDIARQYTDKIFSRSWTGFCDQLNHICEIATGHWILVIDADERCPEDLAEEIKSTLSASPSHVAFNLPRLTRYLGKWMHHGEFYPDYTIRLHKKGKGVFQGEPHAKFIPQGTTGRLRKHILHLGFCDLSHQLSTTDSYTTAAARELFEQGQRSTTLNIIFRPVVRFIKAYIIKLGFLDGWQGFILALMSSYAVFVRYAKLWELIRVKEKE